MRSPANTVGPMHPRMHCKTHQPENSFHFLFLSQETSFHNFSQQVSCEGKFPARESAFSLGSQRRADILRSGSAEYSCVLLLYQPVFGSNTNNKDIRLEYNSKLKGIPCYFSALFSCGKLTPKTKRFCNRYI